MLHPFDNPPPHEHAQRQAWMGLLARAPLALLVDIIGPHVAKHPPKWLRQPETGLMMIQGRVGGSGQRFNLGEITVTRCALCFTVARLDSPVGVAYVLGRNHYQATLAATADALLQDIEQYDALEFSLLEPIRQFLNQQRADKHARAQTTKVDFFTVARETNSVGKVDAS